MGRHDADGRGGEGELGRVLDRNIAALIAHRRDAERRERRTDRIAAAIGRFAGSMTFVWIHVAIVAWWVGTNVGLLPGARFDADFVKLATAASVEAIFISTFVLVTQNSLLAEHELTRLIRLADAMARRLGVEEAGAHELADRERDVSAENVLDRIEQAEDASGRNPAP